MRKVKKLFTLLTALYMSLMLPVQVMAAVDLNTNMRWIPIRSRDGPRQQILQVIQGILMDADTGAVLLTKAGISSVILPVSPRS